MIISSLEELERLGTTLRAQGRTVVFTNGVFDILHAGHVTYLDAARALGDVLIVGVNADDSVGRLKGAERPVNPLEDRLTVLTALRSVDHVIAFSEDTPLAVITALLPQVLVKGGDYSDRPEEIPVKQFVESYGGRLYLTGVVEGVSTTAILRSVAA